MPRSPLTLAFLALLLGVPLGQAGWELARGERVQALDVLAKPTVERLRLYEDELRRASFVHRAVTPWYQLGVWTLLGRGNEKAVAGRGGWLHYRDDLDAITGRGFMDREWTPVDGIADFEAQLAEAGVQLVLVPVPAKTTVEPARFSRWSAEGVAPRNVDHAAFLSALDALRIPVVTDWQKGPYLARDTHWTPAAMERCAAEVAEVVGLFRSSGRGASELASTLRETTATGQGDLVGMLRFPEGHVPFEPMTVALRQVVDEATGEPVEPDPDARVLLLGDSFTRVFSDPALGLGEGAGFAEHLARALGERVDVIAIAGGSALGVREALARRPDGLAGIETVVWQISERDLAADPDLWKPVDLTAAAAAAVEDVGARPSEELVVVAEVTEVTRIPADFEYRFCLAVYEYRVLEVLSGTWGGGPLWVAHVAIEDGQDRPGGAYPTGARHRMRLEPIAEHYDLEATSWMDDTDAGLEIWFATELSPAR